VFTVTVGPAAPPVVPPETVAQPMSALGVGGVVQFELPLLLEVLLLPDPLPLPELPVLELPLLDPSPLLLPFPLSGLAPPELLPLLPPSAPLLPTLLPELLLLPPVTPELLLPLAENALPLLEVGTPPLLPPLPVAGPPPLETAPSGFELKPGFDSAVPHESRADSPAMIPTPAIHER
jgi:hypothetical protein